MQIIFRNYLVFYQLFKFRRTRDIRSNQQCFGAGHFCWLQLQLLRLKATLELERSWSGAAASRSAQLRNTANQANNFSSECVVDGTMQHILSCKQSYCNIRQNTKL